MILDWTRWPNFQPWEFECSHTGKCEMNEAFMDRLQRLRAALGFPLVVNSGYRDPSHPIEAAKDAPGVHTLGRAADIKADGKQQRQIIVVADRLGFTGFGPHAKIRTPVSTHYIHLDDWDGPPRPNLWTY